MEENLAQKSIDFALCCKWKEAIKTNLEILRNEPENIDALNRLAKAYFEDGEVNKATQTSRKVLKIDPINNIATNSIAKFKQKNTNKDNSKKITNSSRNGATFIEEPGKTKITTLINLGPESIYTCLSAGDEVCLVTHAHKVSVNTLSNKYIGKLTDDLSARMRILIKAGKKFHIFIKSINKTQVKIFIKGESISFPLGSSESLGEFNT